MDEKLDGEVMGILANLCIDMTRQQHVSLHDWAKKIEQAFRKAKWTEPQQPEGELVKCPLEDSCDAFREQECDVCTVGQVRQAQLAHTKARMAKVSWLLEPCPHFRRRSHEDNP